MWLHVNRCERCKMVKKILFSTLVVALLTGLLSASAEATRLAVWASVTRTLSDAENFGGCLTELSIAPANVGLDCKGRWVAFSCTGDFAPRDAANRSFDMTQIALVSGAQVWLVIDDSKKHNGYCFAERVALSQPPSP